MIPGFTQAVGIVQPVATAVGEDAPSKETVLVPALAGANPTTFSLFIERPAPIWTTAGHVRTPTARPLADRIPLAARAGTCSVAALQQPLQPGRADFARPRDDELRWIRDVAARGPLITTIIGELSNGAIALINLRADESVLSTLDGALE